MSQRKLSAVSSQLSALNRDRSFDVKSAEEGRASEKDGNPAEGGGAGD